MNPNDIVNIAMICFFVLFGIFLFVLILFFAVSNIKHDRKISKIRNKNFEFIEEYKNDNLPSNQYKNRFDWELKHNYKQNYKKFSWCSMCKYWVEIDDGTEYEYRRGICKVRYKQYMNVENSTTPNDWCCKYFN
jgi:hypothetical protein